MRVRDWIAVVALVMPSLPVLMWVALTVVGTIGGPHPVKRSGHPDPALHRLCRCPARGVRPARGMAPGPAARGAMSTVGVRAAIPSSGT